jgi:hypothetical protein
MERTALPVGSFRYSLALEFIMTSIVIRDAFDRPFRVGVVNGEVTVTSDQAPIELVFTAASARATAERLLQAADQVDAGAWDAPAAKRPTPPV